MEKISLVLKKPPTLNTPPEMARYNNKSPTLTNLVPKSFFEIENAHPDEISKDLTVMNQDFGNFTADTELTFNFRVLSNEEAAKKGVSM